MAPVRCTALAVAAVLALTGRLVSQTPLDDWSFAVSQGRVQGSVLGLLRLPEAVGDGCGSDALRVFALQSIGTATAPPVGTLRYKVSGRTAGGASCDSARFVMERAGGGEEAVPNDESDYEVPALVVLGRRGPWFQVALQSGRAWMRHAAEADFLSYPELLTDRLAYLRAGWDGRLWASPAAKAPQPATAAWRKIASDNVGIEMLGVRRIGDAAWIRVRTLAAKACDPDSPIAPSITGWLPAYRESGQTTAWFHSRGC
jgi:hypothetical protein